MKFTNMNELQSVNVTALLVATIIGSILPFFFALLYIAIRRELVIRELRQRTEAAKCANGDNVVKLRFELNNNFFLLHKRIYWKYQNASIAYKRKLKEDAFQHLENQANTYRKRYKSYTQITIKPF